MAGSHKFGGNFKRIKFLCPYPLLHERRHAVSFDFADVSTKYKPMAYRPLPNPLPRGEGIDWQAVPNLATTSKGLSFCVLDFPHPREKGTSRRVCFSETPRAFRNPTNVRRQSANRIGLFVFLTFAIVGNSRFHRIFSQDGAVDFYWRQFQFFGDFAVFDCQRVIQAFAFDPLGNQAGRSNS